MASKYIFRVLLIISAEQQEFANQFGKQYLDSNGGDNTFSNGYSANGEPPITHYIACSVITKGAAETILGAHSYFVPGAKMWIKCLTSSAEGDAICEAFSTKENVIVGEFDPHAIIEELGLQQVI